MDLLTPAPTDDPPAAERRSIQRLAGFEGTDVYHTLYLPVDWDRKWELNSQRYPVVVEYTGNFYPASGSTGRVDDANLGFGWTGGRDFIWIVLPSVDTESRQNARLWWGDIEATVEYCKNAVKSVCRDYGGDAENIYICGFSRGGIAASHIGLYDEEISNLWRGFFAHDGLHGAGDWEFDGGDATTASRLAKRYHGRSVLISFNENYQLAGEIRKFVAKHNSIAAFTVLPIPVERILEIPGEAAHPHTDLWMHKPSEHRSHARNWLSQNSGIGV